VRKQAPRTAAPYYDVEDGVKDLPCRVPLPTPDYPFLDSFSTHFGE
jgi:hypothetical protein